MKACGIFAASLFGALVAAAPVNKRDVVWVTETAVDIVTVPVTQTVWVGADQTVTAEVVVSSASVPVQNAAVARPTGGRSRRPSSASSSVAAPTPTSTSVYVAPTTVATTSTVDVPSSTSVYVAPTTTSTSVYVAPVESTTSSVYVAPVTSTTSSVYVAPVESTTSVYVAPTTSVYVAPSSTTSTAAAATTTAASSGSGSGLAASGTTYTGDLTWYDTGLGACGLESTSSDHIVAISQLIFDDPQYATANPNLNPLCGRYVSITGKDGSKYQAKVVDRCTGCAESDLDLSYNFFNTVTSNGDGRVSGMSWTWV